MTTLSEVTHESGTKIRIVEHKVELPSDTLVTAHWSALLPVSQVEVSGVSSSRLQAIAEAKLAIEGDLKSSNCYKAYDYEQTSNLPKM